MLAKVVKLVPLGACFGLGGPADPIWGILRLRVSVKDTAEDMENVNISIYLCTFLSD